MRMYAAVRRAAVIDAPYIGYAKLETHFLVPYMPLARRARTESVRTAINHLKTGPNLDE